MRRYILLAFLVLFLVACSKAECKTNSDCTGKPSTAFTATCTPEKTCSYTPIPNKIGNGICETGENKCTAPQDCGTCSGKVTGSTLLVQTCVNNECVQDVQNTKPILVSSEITGAGDKFKIDTEYNQPFNLKKDLFVTTITLSSAPTNKDHRIVRAELIAQTKDRRTITLARKEIDKPLWSVGSSITEEFILDFPAELESELSSVSLSIEYLYNAVSGGKKTPRTGTLKNNYREKITYVNPANPVACPPPAEVAKKCDDKNPGTRDTCDPQTGFCKHDPIPNACGNFRCEGTENKCSCPSDCGPCSGSAGAYTDYSCRANQCITLLKTGVTFAPNSIFDDRNLGPVHLNNNYKFKTPFNAKRDKLDLEFKIYKQDPTVSRVVIETIRILEGQQQLAEANPAQEITTTASTISISLPAPANAEDELNPTVGVWYMYVQNDQERRGNFQKPLGKIAIIAAE